MPRGVHAEYLHNCCLGVCKHLMQLLLGLSGKKKKKSSKKPRTIPVKTKKKTATATKKKKATAKVTVTATKKALAKMKAAEKAKVSRKNPPIPTQLLDIRLVLQKVVSEFARTSRR